MTSDLDIYRTASVLIREHGDEADLVAAPAAEAVEVSGLTRRQGIWLCAAAASRRFGSRRRRRRAIDRDLAISRAGHPTAWPCGWRWSPSAAAKDSRRAAGRVPSAVPSRRPSARGCGRTR